MNGINTTYLLAALLLIAGILGFIAGGSTDSTGFRLLGFLLLLGSATLFIGEALGQARHARSKKIASRQSD